MKRALSLFFVLLVGFNTIGYYGLLVLIQEQLTTHMLQKIDTNANEIGGNIILAIPIESPYASDSEEYTRLDGEIQFGGEIYRLVKQKYYRNMLYVVCLKDSESSRAREDMGDYSNAFSGQQADHANSTIKVINSISKYYVGISHNAKTISEGWSIGLSFVSHEDLYLFDQYDPLFRPPQQS